MDEDLKKYLEQNRVDLAEIRQTVRGIKNHFVRQEIYQWVIILAVVVPFVVVTIMLWPTIKGLGLSYQQLLSNGVQGITGTDLTK